MTLENAKFYKPDQKFKNIQIIDTPINSSKYLVPISLQICKKSVPLTGNKLLKFLINNYNIYLEDTSHLFERESNLTEFNDFL